MDTHSLPQHCTLHVSDKPMEMHEARHWLAHIPGWAIVNPAGHGHACLHRAFDFADFQATMAFVNAVAHMANVQDHHPEMLVSYNRCTVSWHTHSAQGLSLNDFICAAHTDRCHATTATSSTT